MSETPDRTPQPMALLPRSIFASRWLQLPLYLGLIVAQAVYVVHFLIELLHLVEAAFGSQTALQSLITSIGYRGDFQPTSLNETVIMLVVLAMIDVVMISNLLIMVILGGYDTFISRVNLEGHPDEPEWLSHVNAAVLKVKLATAIIGISSIHLLKTFINAATSLSETHPKTPPVVGTTKSWYAGRVYSPSATRLDDGSVALTFSGYGVQSPNTDLLNYRQIGNVVLKSSQIIPKQQ